MLDAGARLLSALLGGFSFSWPSLTLPEALPEEEEKKPPPAVAVPDADEPEGDDAAGDDADGDGGGADGDDGGAGDQDGAGGAEGPSLGMPGVTAGVFVGADNKTHEGACVGEGETKRCAATAAAAATASAAAEAASDESDVLSLAAGTGSSKGAGATAAALASGAGLGALERASDLDKAKAKGIAPSMAEAAEAVDSGAAGGTGGSGGAGAAADDAAGGGAPGQAAGGDDAAGGDAKGDDGKGDGEGGSAEGTGSADGEAGGEGAAGDGKADEGGAGGDAAPANADGDGDGDGDGASDGDSDGASNANGAEAEAEAKAQAARKEADARGPPVAAIRSLAEKVEDEFAGAEEALQAAIANITGEWGAMVDAADDAAIRRCGRFRAAGPRIEQAEEHRRALVAVARAQSEAALDAQDPTEAVTMLTASHEASANASAMHALAVGLAANLTDLKMACDAAVNASRVERVAAMRRAHASVVAAIFRIRQAERRVVLSKRALARHKASPESSAKQVEAYTRLVGAEERFVGLLEAIREDFQATFDAWNASFARPFVAGHMPVPDAEEGAEEAVQGVSDREARGDLAASVEAEIDALSADGHALSRVRAAAAAAGNGTAAASDEEEQEQALAEAEAGAQADDEAAAPTVAESDAPASEREPDAGQGGEVAFQGGELADASGMESGGAAHAEDA